MRAWRKFAPGGRQPAPDMQPRFGVGEGVRVLDRIHSGHMRTPSYVRDQAGVVVRVVGPMLNPEQLAYGYCGVPGKILYRVRFRQKDLWTDYAGGAQDTLELELYEHWLAPCGQSDERRS
jgi:nitrile hydratase subunit beta